MNLGNHEFRSKPYYKETDFAEINASPVVGLPGSVDGITHRVLQLLNADGTPLEYAANAMIEGVTIDVPTDLTDGTTTTEFDIYFVEADNATFTKVEGNLAASSPKVEAKQPDAVAIFEKKARVYLVPRVDADPYTAGQVKISIQGGEPVAF